MLSQVVPLVEVTRGELVESGHVGALAVVDTDGRVVQARGDPSLLTFPRSALKPFQLLPLVAGGGVERFGFTSVEIAVMAASHSGEERHTRAVLSILEKIGAPNEALACGVHAPLDAGAAARLQQAGLAPTSVHNNCSGKHAGMLALARLLGAPLESYLAVHHPAQQAIREALREVLVPERDPMPVAPDGCSAPAYALTLQATARGFARLGTPDGAPARWRAALERVATAMRAHPDMVGGTSGRIDTELMRAPGSQVVAKGGAEAYFGVGHTDGLGLALKILDGDGARRAVRLALLATVRSLGWITDEQAAALPNGGAVVTTVSNWAGRHTGEIRAVPWDLTGSRQPDGSRARATPRATQ